MEKMARKKEEAPQLNDKEKIIDLAMKQIQKEYGEGSIMKLGENQKMNITRKCVPPFLGKGRGNLILIKPQEFK